MKKKHLSLEERQYLYKLREWGHGIREISRRLRRPASTVSREVRRNEVETPFLLGMNGLERAKYSHEKSKARRKQCRHRDRLKCAEIRLYVEAKLKLGWTPELIAGRLSLDHPGLSISHEAIYQWIYIDHRDLVKYLPLAGKNKRRKRGSGRLRRLRQPAAPKRSIEVRPEVVKERMRVGDWEGDTVVSRQSKECVLTLLERKSRYVIYRKLPNCSARSASEVMKAELSNVPRELRHTMTLDNGPENSGHKTVDEVLGIETYFCHPYCASERGGVENANGFFRRFFPKKTNFSLVAEEQIHQAQDARNLRPMKCLEFQTPHEVFWHAFKNACDA